MPYRINVSKPWFKCGGGNDQCKGALAQLRAGNFDQAKGLLDQALPMAGTDAEAQAAVHWGLTLVAEFSADYAGAEEHVNKAIQLQPTENAFSTELASIRQREKDESELRSQGVK